MTTAFSDYDLPDNTVVQACALFRFREIPTRVHYRFLRIGRRAECRESFSEICSLTWY